MNKTILIILGIALAAGIAVWLLLPMVLPEKTAVTEVPAVVETEPAAPEVVVTDVAEEPADELEEPATEPEPSAEEEPAAAPAYAIDGRIASGEYTHSTEVAGVAVYWANDAEVLRVGLMSPGTGYVSIGLDPEQRMEGANFILGAARGDEVVVRDDFGTGSTSHGPDTERGGEDNILASAGVEWADRTIIEFIIPLDSGDVMDKPLVPGNTYTILVSYHDSNDSFTARHSGRGSGVIQLDPAP